MSFRILLTGFEAFGDVATNPAQLAVDRLSGLALPGAVLKTAVLPVSYTGGDRLVRDLLRAQRPDLIIAVGVAANADAVRLERVALNLDDADAPDNDGVVRQGLPIRPDGPPAYFTDLPLSELKDAIQSGGVPVRISNHAGAYLCNHVYYAAFEEAAALGLAAEVLFIHVPLTQELKPDAPVTLDQIVSAVRICLQLLTARK